MPIIGPEMIVEVGILKTIDPKEFFSYKNTGVWKMIESWFSFNDNDFRRKLIDCR